MNSEALRQALCEKIQRWRNWNKFKEEATIVALVLPTLEAVGYEVFDPEQVLPQPRDALGNKPDLVLYKASPFEGGTEWCVVEVKELGESLDKHVSQIGQYLMGSSARWYVLTNGAEWRFYDKEWGGANFYRFTVSLEMPGAIDALRYLLARQQTEPDFVRAAHALIEARLRTVAQQLTWEQHRTIWEHTDSKLAKLLKQEIEKVHGEYPEHHDYIQKWECNFLSCVANDSPPDWWQREATSQPATSASLATAHLPPNAFSLAQMKQRGFDITSKKPKALLIGGKQIQIEHWATLLTEVIRLLDAQRCLPPPPFVPAQTTVLYSKAKIGKSQYSKVDTQMYGEIFVYQHMDARRKARMVCMLLEKAGCPGVSPEKVYIVLA